MLSEVIAIPILVLRKSQLPIRKKIYLGCSLCLSTVVIMVTIVRIAGVADVPHPFGPMIIDTIWQMYWQYVEHCIAIVMVCR